MFILDSVKVKQIKSEMHEDQKYIDALLKDDRKMIMKIYKDYFPYVLSYVTKNGGNKSDANDVFQETILAVYKNALAGKVSLEVKFSSYIDKIYKRIWHRNRGRKNKY